MTNPIQYVAVLDPANLHESGGLNTVDTPPLTKATFVPFITGAPEGYWRVGTMARYKWTTSARRMRVKLYATSGGGDTVGVRIHNGTDIVERYAPGVNSYHNEITFSLGDGSAGKIVELLIPAQNAYSAGGAVVGMYPYEVRFDATSTPVALTSPTNRLGIWADSILGSVVVSPSQYGIAGLMKRGLTVQAGAKWKGAWAGGTAYAIGEYVSSGTWVWKAKTASTGVTPVAGANWELYGYNGSVTGIAYGYRRVADDWSTAPNRTAWAAAVAALGLTRLLCFIGSNDYAVLPPTTLANFTTYIGAGLDALHAAQPALPISVLTSIKRGNGSEVANSNGELLSQFRTAWVNAVAARSSYCTQTDGFVVCDYSDISNDAAHPRRSGVIKIVNALQSTGLV